MRAVFHARTPANIQISLRIKTHASSASIKADRYRTRFRGANFLFSKVNQYVYTIENLDRNEKQISRFWNIEIIDILFLCFGNQKIAPHCRIASGAWGP